MVKLGNFLFFLNGKNSIFMLVGMSQWAGGEIDEWQERKEWLGHPYVGKGRWDPGAKWRSALIRSRDSILPIMGVRSDWEDSAQLGR